MGRTCNVLVEGDCLGAGARLLARGRLDVSVRDWRHQLGDVELLRASLHLRPSKLI